MGNVDAVTSTVAAPPADPGQNTADADLNQAFALGILQFMGVMLEGSQSDITAAIEDTTSDPDAPA